jgi:uncharacterized protein YndB with AHSA1/START domain
MTENIGTITKCYTVTYHRDSKHSAERLWHAITDENEVSAWMGAPAKIDLRAGGDYLVDFHNDGNGLDGVIVRVEDRIKLAYVWGWSYVEWTIESAGDGCRYTFVHNGLADRGHDEEGLPAGWHDFFERLDEHLDGQPFTADKEGARWHALKPLYREQLDAKIRGVGNMCTSS